MQDSPHHPLDSTYEDVCEQGGDENHFSRGHLSTLKLLLVDLLIIGVIIGLGILLGG